MVVFQHTVFGRCSWDSSPPSMVSDPYRSPSHLALAEEELPFTVSKGGTRLKHPEHLHTQHCGSAPGETSGRSRSPLLVG